MSLITDNQRKTAQEPQPQPPALPKPPRRDTVAEADRTASTRLLPEFEQGSGSLQLEQQVPPPAAPTEVEFAAPNADSLPAQAPPNEYVSLTKYLDGGSSGGGLLSPPPLSPAAQVAPATNLWVDSGKDLSVPSLDPATLVTTTAPTVYAAPNVGVKDYGSSFNYTATANSALFRQQQEQRESVAKQAQLRQVTKGAFPNVPDASRPMQEQSWGWAQDFFLGEKADVEAAKRGEVNLLEGRYGKYGSGFLGFAKAAFGVPIAGATALGLEGAGRLAYAREQAFANLTNPTVRTSVTGENGRPVSVERKFKDLSPQQQNEYLRQKTGDNLLFPGSGNIVRPSVSFQEKFGTYVGDVVGFRRDDSLSDANPKLAPVTDARTNAPAEVESPKGFFYSPNKRPGQQWFEDPASAALDLGVQLFSPGNKVDLAGELLGRGLGALAKPIARAVPKPLKRAAASVGKSVGRTTSEVQEGVQAVQKLAAASKPSQVVAVPSQGTGTVLTKPPLTSAVVPEFDPKLTPVLPKTDAEGTAAVVGIGEPGRPLTYTPETGVRTHDQLVEYLRSKYPTALDGYTGTSWAEFQAFKGTRAPAEQWAQFKSAGSPLPTPKLTPTTDDLLTQSRELAEQKLTVQKNLEQLEQVFEETVDVGRRSLDNLPLQRFSPVDLTRALEEGASVRLAVGAADKLPEPLVQALKQGDSQAAAPYLEAVGGAEVVSRLQEQALVPQRVVQKPAKKYLAKDFPKVAYHGTALEQWQPYSVVEFGSRGELGSGLYTTTSAEEALLYSRASVAENVGAEAAYSPLSPQVVELDLSGVRAPLDARASLRASKALSEEVAARLPEAVAENLRKSGLPKTYADLVAKVERAVAQAGGSEELLQSSNRALSDTLRARGYDAVYDRKSGWVALVDNDTAKVVSNVRSEAPTSVMEAAQARYDVDAIAAGVYRSNVTSDANLRDSAYKLLDQTRVQADEQLEQVQQQALRRFSENPPKPHVPPTTNSDAVRAQAAAAPSVEKYKSDIRQFGQPLHPLVVVATKDGKFAVVGNSLALEAAQASYKPGTFDRVLVVELPSKANAKAAGARLVDVQKLVPTEFPYKSAESVGKSKRELETYGFTSAPPVLEETEAGFRVLDREYSARAYLKSAKEGNKDAEVVQAVVVGLNGKATVREVPLSSIRKKATEAAQAEVVPKALDKVVVKYSGMPTLADKPMKELRALAASLGVKGKTKAQLAERIAQAQAAASAKPTVEASVDALFAKEQPSVAEQALEVPPIVNAAKTTEDLLEQELKSDVCEF